jgi:hypothetical protein
VENSEKTCKRVSEEVEVIHLRIEQEKKELKISTLIMVEERDGLIFLLHEYVNVFDWTYLDMLGLDTDIVVHRFL